MTCPPSLHIEIPRKAVRRLAMLRVLARAERCVPAAERGLGLSCRQGHAICALAQPYAAKAAGLASEIVLQ
jgi:hypothetical protein